MNDNAGTSHRTAIWVAVIGLVGTLGAALITVLAVRGNDTNGGNGDRPATTVAVTSAPTTNPTPETSPTFPTFTDPSVFLNRDSGPGGTTVLVSGTDFAPGERVVISFHTEQVGATTAGDDGGFANVAVVIPTSFSVFAPQQFQVVASGESSLGTARAPFTITG